MVLGLLLTGTVTALLVLWWQWRRGRTLLDRRQVGLRLLGGTLVAAIWLLLGAMLLAIRPLEQPLTFLSCFYVALGLAAVLPGVAWLDLRCLRRNRHRAEQRLTEDFIRLATVSRTHDG